MTNTQDIIEYKGFLWTVEAMYPPRIGKTDGYDYDFLRDKYNADIILKRSNKLLVCKIVEEIEFEEITEKTKEIEEKIKEDNE